MNLNLAVIAMQNMSQFNFTDTEQSTLYASYFYGYAPVMILSQGSLPTIKVHLYKFLVYSFFQIFVEIA